MAIDSAGFPIVRVDSDRPSGPDGADPLDEYFQAIEALFLRNTPFVLLSSAPRQAADDRMGDKGRLKRTSLWMKRHRQELKLIRAMIIVEPEAVKRYAGQAMATVFGRFWGYPLLFAATVEEAGSRARVLLSKGAPSLDDGADA